MTLTRKAVFVLVAILAGTSALQTYPQESIDINGYLVDSNDKPLRNGRITLFYDPPLPNTSFDELIVSWAPLEDGLFGMATQWHPGRKIFVLIEDRPEGYYPIKDPSALTNLRIFKGVVISKYSRETDLGRIREYVRYGQAAFDVAKCSASILKGIAGHRIFLKVTTPDGFAAANTTFSSAYVPESKQVVLNLPAGEWYLDLIDESTSKPIGPTVKVAISPYETTWVTSLECD